MTDITRLTTGINDLVAQLKANAGGPRMLTHVTMTSTAHSNNGVISDLLVRFNPTLKFDRPDGHYIKLQADIPETAAAFGTGDTHTAGPDSSVVTNNVFSFRLAGAAAWQDANFGNGTASIEDLNSKFNGQCILYGNYVVNGTTNEPPFSFVNDRTTGKCQILFNTQFTGTMVDGKTSADYKTVEIRLDKNAAGTASEFYKLIGFSAAQAASVKHDSDSLSPLVTSANNANVQDPLIRFVSPQCIAKYGGSSSGIFYTDSFPGTFGTKFRVGGTIKIEGLLKPTNELTELQLTLMNRYGKPHNFIDTSAGASLDVGVDIY